MSLRLRLTLWYSGVLAGALLVFGFAIYFAWSYTLVQQIDLRLEAFAQSVARSLRVDSLFGAQVLSLADTSGLEAPMIHFQVWSNQGRLLTQSERLTKFKFTKAFDDPSLNQAEAMILSTYIGQSHMRVYTIPATQGDQIVAYVQVATSLEPVDSAQKYLLALLGGGGTLAVVVVGFLVWFTAGRALRPLDTMTQTALQITRADDLSRRIPLSDTQRADEAGRLAMAFNESLERLERLFNAQRRFLADVSHELRTPLTAIRGNVDLLRRMGGADAESLDAIQSEAERMSRLVGDLLMLAQADAGNLPLVKKPVELDTLLFDVFREAQVLASGVFVTIGDIDQVIVNGDRDRLKQLLLNLVTNALKFTPEGGRVTLGLGRINDWARVTVTDTGIGIPPHELTNIFERFYRVDKARSRAMGGAGLGLSIAQRIAMMHGGRIEAMSEGVPGRGSTFSLWIPLDPANQAPAAPSEAKTRPRLPAIHLPRFERFGVGDGKTSPADKKRPKSEPADGLAPKPK